MAHLRTLEAVARRGSFSRAAHELHITQPAVSMQIRALEKELGAALLERVGKRAFPTAAGELLLAHGVRARRELETAVERIQGLKGIVAGCASAPAAPSAPISFRPPWAPSAPGTRAPTSSSSPAMRRRSRARWWRATSTSAS